jgi:hypothetical protein
VRVDFDLRLFVAVRITREDSLHHLQKSSHRVFVYSRE